MKKIPVRIDTHLVFKLDDLGPIPVKALREAFTRSNPQFWKKKRMGFWIGDTSRTIESWKIEGDKFLMLPRGAKDKINEVLAPHNMQIGEVTDRTVSCKPAGFSIREGESLRPDQVPVVNFLVQKKNAIVRGPPGSGKTVILLGAIVKINQPAVVVVHSNLLREQWQDAVVRWLGVEPGVLGGGKKKLAPITIATQQTLWRMVKEQNLSWVQNFSALIADECHRWSSKTFNAVAEMFPATYRLAASADERRKDQKEFLLYETFGTDVYKIKKSTLVRSGHLLPTSIEVVPTNYRDGLYLASVRAGMFCDECGGVLTASRHERLKGVKHCSKCNLASMRTETPDWPGMLNRIVEDKDRNTLILDYLVKVLKQDPDSRVLILSERVQACRQWVAKLTLQDIPAGLLIGSPKNRQELTRTVAGLQSGKLRVGVGTTVADEGLDIPALTHVFITCPVHTHPKRLRQMVGRSARPFGNKKEGKAIYFWDREMFPPLIEGIKPSKHESQCKSLLKKMAGVVDELTLLE